LQVFDDASGQYIGRWEGIGAFEALVMVFGMITGKKLVEVSAWCAA
jgi:hypothetical protein